MAGYKQLSERLGSLGIDHHASELHGVVTGYACAGGSRNNVSTLLDWLGLAGVNQADEFLGRLIEETRGRLSDPELGFEPSIPGDQQTLRERSHAISLWCRGFISGFGAVGSVDEATIDDEVKEIISDLHKITVMTDQVPETDENEADLTEIIEYVRVSALLVFATCALTDGREEQ